MNHMIYQVLLFEGLRSELVELKGVDEREPDPPEVLPPTL